MRLSTCFQETGFNPRKNLTNNTSRCSIADNCHNESSARHSVKSPAFFLFRMMYERWVVLTATMTRTRNRRQRRRVVVGFSLLWSKDAPGIFSLTVSCDDKYIEPNFDHVGSLFSAAIITFLRSITTRKYTWVMTQSPGSWKLVRKH